MYFNKSHKETVEYYGNNNIYIGSYKDNEPTLDNKYRYGNAIFIRVKCSNCGKEYDVNFRCFLIGKEVYCSRCCNKLINPKKSFGYLYPEKIEYWSKKNKISPFKIDPKSKHKYLFICQNCGKEFRKNINNFNRKDIKIICPECSSSKGESKIIKYLDKHNIHYFYDIPYFDDLRGLGGGLLRPDFVIPDKKIWIEYDGKQHEEWIKNIMQYDDFLKLKKHDEIKNKYAKKHNWRLIRISYHDFDNIEEILEKTLYN